MTEDQPRGPAATSFGAVAQTYARARPSYPDAAVDWLLEGCPVGGHVVDVGAGTGALTRSLVGRGLRVSAVEPSEGMRKQLSDAVAGVEVVAGSAEDLPLADATADVVVFAQAWHWVDPSRALPQVARVLRAGGRLGLVWNVRDEREPWVAELGALMAGHGAGLSEVHPTGLPVTDGSFGPLDCFETTSTQPMTVPRLVDLVSSRSYVITMATAERAHLLAQVAELGAAHPALAGRAQFDLPYVTRCWRVRRF